METTPQIALSVRFVDATAATSTPLHDVEVCVADRPDVRCGRSDAEGRLAMLLPAETELMLRCASDDHGPAYMTLRTSSEDLDAGTFSLLAASSQAAFVAFSGGTSWPDTGALTVNVFEDLVRRDTRVAGAVVTIQPSGSRPTYVSEMRRPDRMLVATTTGGPALFYDLPDHQEVTVTIQHPSRTCRGGFGWPTGRETSLRGQVFAGGLSNLTFVCPP